MWKKDVMNRVYAVATFRSAATGLNCRPEMRMKLERRGPGKPGRYWGVTAAIFVYIHNNVILAILFSDSVTYTLNNLMYQLIYFSPASCFDYTPPFPPLPRTRLRHGRLLGV